MQSLKRRACGAAAALACLVGLVGLTTTVGVAGAPAAAAATTGQPGYWLAASDGGVYGFGTGSLGEIRGTPLQRPVVGITATNGGGGYWMVASDGGIFSYGDATFHGSTGGMHLNQPIVGMAAAPGGGYWLVASDGGIFAFDATFHGSTGGMRLNQPIVGMAAAPGGGYWLVASDGGIFAFGGAPFYGSMGGHPLNQPIVGMAATPSGKGYWLVARDGGIFSFGDATFHGSTGGTPLNQPIVGMAADPVAGSGYWLVAADGGLFSFDAPYFGSTGGSPGPAPVVGMAATPHGAFYPPGQVGTDVSWPQCGGNGTSSQAGPLPAAGNPVSVVGVNGGTSTDFNPCFVAEAANAGANLTVYLNTEEVTPGASTAMSGPAGSCASGDLVCQGYNWGWSGASTSIGHVHALGYRPGLWWLDVEAPCGFQYPLWMCGSSGQASNAAVIRGAVDAIHAAGLVAGIYSTDYQWTGITGGSPGNDAVTYPGLPVWIAWAPSSSSQATRSYWASICTNPSYVFAAGRPTLVQWVPGSGQYPTPEQPYDADLAC